MHGDGSAAALQLHEPPVLSGKRDGVLAPERVLLQAPALSGYTGPHGHHGQPGPVPPDVSPRTVRGADEIPVEVWGRGQVVGQPAAARAVQATLGGAVQQLQQHLLSQPIGRSAAHHCHTAHRSLAFHFSGSPAAANQSHRTRGQERARSDRQRDRIWSPCVLEIQCYCFINRQASHTEVQTGYTKIMHLFI